MCWRDPLGKCDHLRHIVGRDRPFAGRDDVEVGDILLESLRVVGGNVPDALGAGAGRRLHLVIARIRVAGQMADIGVISGKRYFIAEIFQRAPD